MRQEETNIFPVMKKISNEVKVGAIALITILIFIWLYNFLKGKDLFSSTATYYVVYDKVGGLAESSPVEVNGYKVGVVQSIKFLDALSGKLLVVLSVDRNFRLPVNTVAEITTATLVAGMKVQFIYGEGPDTYNYNDTIPGRLAESIIGRIESELGPLSERIIHLIGSLDSVVSSLNEVIDADFRKNIGESVAALNSTASSLSSIIGSKEAELKETLVNINEFTSMLAANSEKMSNTFSSLESIADTIASSDIYTSAVRLRESLEKTSLLLDKINKGEGTAGQLITNDSLYNNLSKSLGSLDLLLQDLKENPGNYVHFSLFGRKNKSD